MTAYDQMNDAQIEALVRGQMHRAAMTMSTPDVWAGISRRIGAAPSVSSARKHRKPFTARWLTPAGTALFVIAVVAVWVMLLNSGSDGSGTARQPDQNIVPGSHPEDGAPVDETVFAETLALLEAAGPFRVVGELFSTSRRGGWVEALPDGLDIPINAEGETLRVLEWQPEVFNSLQPMQCVEIGPDRACSLGPGTILQNSTAVFLDVNPVAVEYVVGGTYRYESLFVSPELYRIERTLEVSPEFKTEIARKLPGLDISRAETTVEILQQKNRYFDSSSPAVGGYGAIADGSADLFLSFHLSPYSTQIPVNSVFDLVKLSNAKRLSPESTAGTVHYRAEITGELGESGTWDIWIGEDGLPQRIKIEAFNSPRRARVGGDELELTRIDLSFYGYGEPVDPEDPLARLAAD